MRQNCCLRILSPLTLDVTSPKFPVIMRQLLRHQPVQCSLTISTQAWNNWVMQLITDMHSATTFCSKQPIRFTWPSLLHTCTYWSLLSGHNFEPFEQRILKSMLSKEFCLRCFLCPVYRKALREPILHTKEYYPVTFTPHKQKPYTFEKILRNWHILPWPIHLCTIECRGTFSILFSQWNLFYILWICTFPFLTIISRLYWCPSLIWFSVRK
jgi:hypothetical protein